MTRLLTCGYETGDVAEAGVSTTGGSGRIAVATATPTPRAATYCLKFDCASSNGWAYKTYTFAASKTEFWARFAVYLHGVTTSFMVCLANDSAGNPQNFVSFDGSDSLVRLVRGSTTIATSTLTMSQDAWHLIELREQITSTSSGTTEVWVDGARWINFTGDNSNTTNVNFQSLQVGSSTAASITSAIWMAFDDLAINDTSGSLNNGQINNGYVVLLKPSGAGSNTNMTRGGTDTGANYSQVNELPPSMSQYVGSSVTTTRDTYALDDLPGTAVTVSAAEVVAYALNSDSGGGSLGLTVKSSTTTDEGTAQQLGITAQYFRQLYETDPATTAAWTVTNVNALEAGATVR